MAYAVKKSFKENKANAILDAATAYLVTKPAASLQEIAAHAGIGIATLHRYFPSREDLMMHLALRATSVIKSKLEAIQLDDAQPERYLPLLIESLIPLGDKVFFLTYEATLDNYPEVAAAEKELKLSVQDVLEQLQQRRLLRSDLSSEWMVETLYALLFVTWENIQRGKLARVGASGLLLETVFNGFAPRTDKG